MTDLLSLGASGIRAYSRALSTVADNIANAQSPGYARRAVRLEEAAGSGDLVLFHNNVAPGGVRVSGVARAVDVWLIDDARVANSDAATASARAPWMDATERALDDGASGVGAAMTSVFGAADRLTGDPTNAALRQGFIDAVDTAATAFRRSATALASVADGIAAQTTTTVDSVNTSLTALERVNDGLRRAREGSSNQAALLDERDRLIDGVAQAIGVTTSFGPRGEATLRIAGPSADLLVGAGGVATLGATINTAGRLTLSVVGGSPSVALVSGELAGLSLAAGSVADRRASLDGLARQFATNMNTAHSAGLTDTGAAGAALIDIGSGAATIAALATAPSALAVADATSSNGTMLALSGLRGATGVEASWASLVALGAQATAAARAQESATATRRDGANAARDLVSAVDLDHEAAELLRFQQAYEGAAKTIQIARETMQTILGIF